MASDATNCGARLAGGFEFLHRSFSCTVVCEPFTFNIGLNSYRFNEGINAVDPHSLSLIPHLRLRALNHREVKWLTAFHFLGLCDRNVFRSFTGHLGPAHKVQTFSAEPLFFFAEVVLTRNFCVVFAE